MGVIIVSYIPKTYPDSERFDNQTEPIHSSNIRAVIFRSLNRTTDSRETVTDWYAQSGQYGSPTSNEALSAFEQSGYWLIPTIGEAEIHNSVMIHNCRGDGTTCIFHASRLHIKFNGFLGKELDKLLNKI